MEKETKRDMEMEIEILEKFRYSRWAWNQAKFGVEIGKNKELLDISSSIMTARYNRTSIIYKDSTCN